MDYVSLSFKDEAYEVILCCQHGDWDLVQTSVSPLLNRFVVAS